MILKNIITIAIYLAISAGVGFTHYTLLKRRSFGGLYAAMGVSLFGAIIGGFAFDWILCRIMDLILWITDIINWLMKNADARILPPVNLVAAILGSFLLVYVYYRISPGKGDK